MTQAARNVIRQRVPNGIGCQNAGLALERYLSCLDTPGEESKEKNKDRRELLENVCRTAVPGVYAEAYDRWDRYLQASGAKCEKLKVLDRLIVGLGSESALETAITLNRLYGVPVIPGSALKGLSRHYFLHEVAEVVDEKHMSKEHRALLDVLFGSQDTSGYITYFDAWYVPNGKERPLRGDVITVHHPSYYSSKGEAAAPTDFDDPNPVSFISAVGSYLVAVRADMDDESAAEAWANAALDLLRRALADYGVGGKTSSGYGRLMPESRSAGVNSTGSVPGPVGPAVKKPHPLVQAIGLIPNNRLAQSIYGFYQQWQQMPDGPDKLDVARALLPKLQHSSVRTRWEGKPLAEVTDYLSKAG